MQASYALSRFRSYGKVPRCSAPSTPRAYGKFRNTRFKADRRHSDADARSVLYQSLNGDSVSASRRESGLLDLPQLLSMRAESGNVHCRPALEPSRDHLTRIVGPAGLEIRGDHRVRDEITLRATAPDAYRLR